MWLAKLNSELSLPFTSRDLKFGGTVRLRVGYCLGGGQLSVSSYSCVMKEGPMVLLSGGMMDGPHGAVPIIIGGAWVVHGTTLSGADGRGSLGWIVGVIVSCDGVMASQNNILVITGRPE